MKSKIFLSRHLKHEHWCFHFSHDLNIHYFVKKQFCVKLVTQLQISKISIRYLTNEHWYFHFLGFNQTNFGYLCREETDSWSHLWQFDVGDCGTGLIWGGRFYCWTFLLWEIVVLDYFAVGDSTAGLFCCGRFRCWTF